MFHLFERLLVPTALPPDAAPPAVDSPRALLRFYWHFIAQAPWLVVALFATGLVVALLDTTIPVFIGRVASLVATKTPATLFHDAGRQLLGMAAVLLLARPAALLAQYLVTNQAIAAGLSNMIRWQNHWHVVRQSWTFFQNDFAGRIANRVIQTGASLRESVVQGTNAVWYLAVYGGSAIVLLARMDWRLALPIACWFVGYIGVLWLFVPRMRERSRRMSEVRSSLTGRIVDSYTNILTVKLFARSRDEDAFVRDAVDEHTEAFRRQLRLVTLWSVTLAVMNALLVTGVGTLAILAWRAGRDADRHGGDRAAAGVADLQHGGVGGAEHHRHLRERGRGAGRHALDRGAAADGRSAGRACRCGWSRVPSGSSGSASTTAGTAGAGGRCAARARPHGGGRGSGSG